MLNAGKELGAVSQALKISDTTLDRWRAGYRRGAVVGGEMKCEEAKRLKHPEDGYKRLRTLVADLSRGNQKL